VRAVDFKATSKMPMFTPLERTCRSEYTQYGCFRRPAQGRACSPRPDSGQEIVQLVSTIGNMSCTSEVVKDLGSSYLTC